jgi:hypothetical protein
MQDVTIVLTPKIYQNPALIHRQTPTTNCPPRQKTCQSTVQLTQATKPEKANFPDQQNAPVEHKNPLFIHFDATFTRPSFTGTGFCWRN